MRKFYDLQILDIATGLRHILLFARSKSSPSTSLDITSSDPNENIPINCLPDSDSDALLNRINDEKRKSIDEQNNSFRSSKSCYNSHSSTSILTKQTLGAKQETEQLDKHLTMEQKIIREFVFESSPNPNLNLRKDDKKLTTESIIIETEPKTESDKNSTENQSTFFNQNQTMDNIVGGTISNIGDSIMTDIKSIASFGKENLNDLTKETGMAVNEFAKLPKNIIDYVKTSVNDDDKKDDETEANINGEKVNSRKDLPKQLAESKLSNDNSTMMPGEIATLHGDDSNRMKLDQQNEMDEVIQNNNLNRGTTEDKTSNMGIDTEMNRIDSTLNTGKFVINNGVP